ncbi:hypothetical protein [Methylomicrobium lacus]|uniref:hypothetical protein n=1 Tax=Methylomicrobium lacus TaxID=136992 RepID=UPI0035A841FF
MDQQVPTVNIDINIDTSVPLVHPTAFSKMIGLSDGVVGGWIDLGYLPTVKVGRYQLINLALLSENLKKGKVL